MQTISTSIKHFFCCFNEICCLLLTITIRYYKISFVFVFSVLVLGTLSSSFHSNFQ
uniref:Uncharacterized protein n=1 Tax=Anguilla anguilla TaxID=7936 RepID=A0A0E9Y0D8_ANGAN